eukprot:4826111-Ditylum_brightwellii.AAC.1
MTSVDGMLGKEGTMVLKQISRKLAQKWECSPGLAANYVKMTMSLSIICETCHCLRGAQVPSRMMITCHCPCKDGASIGLLISPED